MGQANGKARLRPAWIVCLFVALTPAIMAATTWAPDGYFSIPLYFWRFLAPPVIAIELTAIVIALAAGYRPLISILALPGWAAAAIGLLVAIDIGDAFLVAPDRGTALMRGMITLNHLLFGFAVVHLLRASGFRHFRALWWTLLGGAVLYMAIMIAFVAAITQPSQFDWLHFGLGVVNIRHVGFYVMVGASLAFGIAATENRPRFYWLAVVAATLCCAEFFWSGSRAPVAVLFLSCLAGVIFVPALRTQRLLIAMAIAYVGGAALSMLHTPPVGNYGLLRMLTSVDASVTNDATSGRIDLWRGSIRALFERPITGYGEGQFTLVVPESGSILYHPHNLIFQALVQWGMAGTLLFLALAAALWWRLLLGTRRAGARAAPAFLTVNTFLAYAMVDGVFFFLYPAMIFAFLIAAAFAAGEGRAEEGQGVGDPASA